MNSPKEFSADYLKYLSSLLEKLSNEDIARFINQILDVRENNRKIFLLEMVAVLQLQVTSLMTYL